MKLISIVFVGLLGPLSGMLCSREVLVAANERFVA